MVVGSEGGQVERTFYRLRGHWVKSMLAAAVGNPTPQISVM